MIRNMVILILSAFFSGLLHVKTPEVSLLQNRMIENYKSI